jgi:dipeptidase
MRRSSLVLILILLVVLAAAAAAGLAAGGSAAPPPQVDKATTHWCSFFLAGKNATADGSVLMGYNNDWSANNHAYLQVVPGDATHYQFVQLLTKGDCEEGGVNVHQLAALYGSFTDIDPAVLAADPYVRRGHGGEIWKDILQQCTTARQAINLLDDMAADGFEAGAAGAFAIGDPNHIWLFELLGGHHWVAQKLPSNAFLAHPNMITIRQVDLSDTAHFRGSDDLVSFAQSIGRYDPSEGPFDVAWAYGERTELQSYYNTNRLWGAFNLVAPSLGLTPDMPFATRPVYVVPDEPLTRQDFAEICRYHYEGTEIDETDGYALMSPHDQTNRPICDSTTDYGAVWQLRDWLPDAIGGVMWVAPNRPCSSAYVPFYDSITSVPVEWTDATAYNAFRAVADSLDKKGKVNGVRRYKYYGPLVRSTYGAFESSCTSAQACVESTATCLSGSARIQYLTDYSTYRATQALDLALGLPAQMP